MTDTLFDPEEFAAELAERWTGARPGECLYCYLTRQLGDFGCHGSHEATRRWCEAQPFSTRWVVGFVQRNGGCCCDCEVLLNVLRDDRRSTRHRQLRCAASYARAAGLET